MNAENKICAEARPIIQVNNLTKSFGKLEVLKGISETIYEGEVVSIIGPSGGGKSTFLRCLNLLETPDSGTILFRNSNITDRSVNVDQYRQHLGMVFQHFNIFPHLKVIDNVTLAPVLEKKIPKTQAKAAALRLLERVGLSGQKKTNIPTGSPGVRNSGWPSSVLWRWSRRSCSLTNPPPPWIRKW